MNGGNGRSTSARDNRRWRRIGTGVALGTALGAGVLALPGAPAAPGGGGRSPGTLHVITTDAAGHQPHVPCDFRIELSGFDASAALVTIVERNGTAEVFRSSPTLQAGAVVVPVTLDPARLAGLRAGPHGAHLDVHADTTTGTRKSAVIWSDCEPTDDDGGDTGGDETSGGDAGGGGDTPGGDTDAPGNTDGTPGGGNTNTGGNDDDDTDGPGNNDGAPGNGNTNTGGNDDDEDGDTDTPGNSDGTPGGGNTNTGGDDDEDTDRPDDDDADEDPGRPADDDSDDEDTDLEPKDDTDAGPSAPAADKDLTAVAGNGMTVLTPASPAASAVHVPAVELPRATSSPFRAVLGNVLEQTAPAVVVPETAAAPSPAPAADPRPSVKAAASADPQVAAAVAAGTHPRTGGAGTSGVVAVALGLAGLGALWLRRRTETAS